MSKFNTYFRKLDSAAREAFIEYEKAEDAYIKAERRYNGIKQPVGSVTAEYAAQAARAKADYLEAQQSRRKAQENITAAYEGLGAIRKELAAEIEREYSANPADVDANTLELLKSGILKGAEYSRLMNDAAQAGNHTMVRLIGRYAGEAAKPLTDKNGSGDPEAVAMRYVEARAREVSTGAEYLQAFDAMANTLKRCGNNPGIIGHWDELTRSTVENA